MSVDVRTREQLWKTLSGEHVEKHAELANTYDMPWSPADKDKPSKLKTVNKTASVIDVEDEILKQAMCPSAPEDNEDQQHEEQPDRLAQNHELKSLRPRVDVSGKEPPKVVSEKTAQHYALPSLMMYPLDGYDQVEKAASYFEEFGKRMEPTQRREYCQNLVKRASALDIPVSQSVADYGADTWASSEQLEFALDARKSVLLNPEHVGMYDKLAEMRPTYRLNPELYAEALGELDKVAGVHYHYGRDVPDPFASTFAKRAEAEQESETEPDETYLIGNEYMPKRALVEFSKRGFSQVVKRFGEEIAKSLVEDPGSIFDSLPRDQKLVLMRMVNNSSSLGQGASTS